MAIIRTHYINRYKEVIVNQPAGLVEDGGFSTYTLNDPTAGAFGTSDFFGVIKSVTLIGEIVEVTIDTGRFSVGQINNTSQADFDQQVLLGNIKITEKTLGWVEIGKSRASFYYEECTPTSFVRKKPISEHYYDFSTFAFGNTLVNGSGQNDVGSNFSVGEAALRPIGTFDQNIGLGAVGPRFEPMDLQSYMRQVVNSSINGNSVIQNITGETRPVPGYSPLDGQILRDVQLYIADREEHFNNQNAQTISTGKYGRNRSIISEGFRVNDYTGVGNFTNVNFFKSSGECLVTTITSTTSTTSGDVGGVFGGPVSEIIDIQTPLNNPFLAKQYNQMISDTISKVLSIDPNFKFKSLGVDNTDNFPLVFFTPNEWPEFLQYSLMVDTLLKNAFLQSKTIKNIDEARQKRLSGNDILNDENSQNSR